MEYIEKYATKDQLSSQNEIRGNKYFDKRGILQPGYTNTVQVHHFAILALVEWGQQNTKVKGITRQEHNLLSISIKTDFEYEIKTLVTMMHWDVFNKIFINASNKKGTPIEELQKRATLTGAEERLRKKSLLKIQENIMNKVATRRAKCKKISKLFVENLFTLSPPFAPPPSPPSSFLKRWARMLGLSPNKR